MKRLRILFVSILMLIVGCGAVVFSACGEDNDNMSISLSTSELEIVLGENDNTGTIYATVENATNKNLTVQYDSKSIQVKVGTPSSDGISEITVTALRACQNVEVVVNGVSKSTVFTVTATLPITAIIPNQDTYSLSYDAELGGTFELSKELFTISPEGTSQTELNFNLVDTIEGVTIENDVLTIQPGLSDVPEEITVEVVSAHRDNVRTNITIHIVNAINVNNVQIVDQSGARLDSIEISRTNQSTNVVSIYVRVPYSVTAEKLKIVPQFAYNDKGIVLDSSLSYPVDSGLYYEYVFNFTLTTDTAILGQDIVWFLLSYENYPEIIYSTANAQNGRVRITVIDEIRDISITNNGLPVDISSPINLYTTYSSDVVEGYALTFTAVPSTATSAQLSLNISAADQNYVTVRNSRGQIVQFTNGKFLFDSGETFYFIAKDGFSLGDTITVTLRSEKESIEIEKNIIFSLLEGVTSIGFVNSAGDGILVSREFYLDTNQFSSYLVQVAVAPTSIDLTNANVVEIYSTSDAFFVGQIINTNQTLNGANIYTVEIIANNSGSGELVISFVSGQIIRATVNVIDNLSDVRIEIDPNFSTSTAVGNLIYEDYSLAYVALKNGQSLPLTFTGNAEIESVTFNFVDYIYDENTDDVYDYNGAYVTFGQNCPADEAFTSNNSNVISANYLRSLNYLSPIAVGKVWIRVTFTGKQIIEDNGDYIYTDIQLSKYILVEIYNPIISIEIDARDISLYPADELGQGNDALSEQIITFIVNRGEQLPTYNLLEIENMTDVGNGLYQYFIPGGKVNFEIEKINDYQFLVRALTRNDDGTDGIGETEFESTIVNFVSHDLNLDRNKYSISVTISMKKPQLVEQVVIGNVSDDGIYLMAQNLTDDVSLKSFKLVANVLPSDALTKGVVYRFIPNNGTLSTIINISDDGLITTTGNIGGSGKIRVIPKDSVFIDESGHEYYRDGYVYAEVDILVADGRSRETAIRVSNLSEITDSNLHYVLLNNVTFTSTEQIFTTFAGGLYGSLEQGSNFVATITMLSSSNLFGTLSNDGIIEDLIIVGNVNAASMVVDTNTGTIRNITVDVFTQGNTIVPSSVTYSQGNAGGIAQNNTGIIENVTFAGNISATQSDSIIGGIVAINNGQILDCKVLFYNFQNNTTTKFEGTLVGIIAGELTGSGIIRRSYAYSFSLDSVSSSQNVGAVVGLISSRQSKIDQVFSDIGAFGDFYASLGEGIENNDLTSLISDSYTITKSNNEILFKYYMTNTLRNTISGQFSNNDSQSYTGISMNTSNSIWYNLDAQENYGFPYLYNVRPISAITSDDLASLRITQSRLSLAENGDEQSGYEAIMFVYRTYGVNLTNREQQLLSAINTISYGELFGTYALGGLIITSSDNSVISTLSDSLMIKNVGNTTLTIRSKYDYSIEARQVNINVIYYTSELMLSYNNQNLGNSSNINIRTRVNETLESSIESSIILVDRQISLMQNDFAVSFVDENDNNVNFIIGSQIGIHTIVSTFEGENITINTYLTLEGLSENNQKSLEEYTKKSITLQKIYGPVSLILSSSNATISASDELSIVVEITSDTKYLESLAGSELVIDVFDSNGDISHDVVYDINFNQETDQIENSDGTTTRTYIVVLHLDTSISIFDNSYKILFYTDSPSEYDNISATFNLTVLKQEILRVDVNHYAYRGVGNEEGVSLYNYYPNNVLSPNTTGLLDIMVFPSYANYTHVTVTSEPLNGQTLSFLNMKKSGQGYKVNLANTFEYINNGIKIYKVEADTEVARYYVRVRVPENVDIDTVYTITITVYNGDEVLYTLPYSLIIVPQERAGITVDGQTSIYAIRGDTITADIVWDQTQTINSIVALDGLDSETQLATDITVPPGISDADKEEYATSYYKASIDIGIGENSGNFRIRVGTLRTLNGVEQIVYSYLTVYVIDFELDFENTHLANEDGSDTVSGDKYFYHSLKFNFGGKYVESQDDSVSYSENAYRTFVENNYYANGDYVVNIDGVKIEGMNKYNLLYNLHYVNGNSYTPVMGSSGTAVKPDNAIVEFMIDSNGDVRFIGTQNGVQQMMLQMRVQMPDGTMFTYSYFFDIVISDPTSDDSPAQISNAQEFLDAINGTTEEDYILTSDIYLYDYTPATDTSMIRSLDGNGYQIVIVGFNYDNTQSRIDLSLFNTVSANTTLKNLRVNVYHIGTINIQSAFSNTVNIAPIAITNNGIITNCEVVSYRVLSNEVAATVSGINVNVDSTIGVSATTAGFVITNNGIITNSRVGGNSVTEYDYDLTLVDGEYVNTGTIKSTLQILSPFVISSFGEIAGFVYQNTGNGHIVSSYSSNIRIINNSNIDYATITAGFVINNAGLISTSYSKGVKQDETDIHATLYGIETSGISAGFVYENSGEINNSYSNITLTNQNDNPGRNSAGFVYRNTSTGIIETSLSLSRIVGSTTTQMNFAGVDDYGNYQNSGEITNSYYYDETTLSDSSILIESAYGESATYISNVTLEDYFYGFSFTSRSSDNVDDGIWRMTTYGPELVSANQIAVSLRYASQNDPNTRPIFTYVDEYQYGSKNNPILIRSADEFSRVFSGTDNSSASRYVNVELGEIFGSYRLINDIDLSELITDSDNTYTLASSSMMLTGKYIDQGDGKSLGKFDGNGLTINGLALSDPDGEAVNFGLFASITDGAIVQNVNLILGSTNAGGDVFGVEATGVEYVGALAGTVSDSKVLNVSLNSAYANSSYVTVRGKNIVGGLIGRVIGDSFIFNLTVTDISVTASMNPNNYVPGSSYISYNTYNRTSDLLNEYVSYAGGVVGVIDVYTESSVNITTFADTEVYKEGDAVMLKTKGTNIISGGTIGGVVGYIGALTVLQDALYELSYVEPTEYSQQGLYSYNGFAGGIVGYNGGYIRQVRSEHEYSWQIGDSNPNDSDDNSIEANIKNYYSGDYTVDRGNTVLFQTAGYTPIAIGGLVGIQVSGKIEKSYSKLNVINTRTRGDSGVYAGGIVGLAEKSSNEEYVEPSLVEIYASGDVQSITAAGIIGYTNSDMRFDKVNAINYWGNWLIDPSQGGIADVIANVANNVEIIGTGNIMAFANNEIKFTITQDNSSYTTVPDEDKLVNNSNTSLDNSLSSLRDTISGVGDDGEQFDVYFIGNDWDRNTWSRDDNELYPHIVFGYSSSLIYIRTEEDIEKLRISNEGDVFVIAPDAPGPKNTNVIISGVEYIGITKPITPITTFSGTLRGIDNRSEYGFLFTNNVTQSRSLFLNSIGAIFSNFTISLNEGSEFNSASTAQNAILVANATNTQFSDLTFTNFENVTMNNSVTRFGFVAGFARGSTTFNNIEIANSNINVNGQINNAMYLGFIFGDSNFTSGGVTNVTLISSNITFKDLEKAEDSTISVGLIGARLSSYSVINIAINGSADDNIEGSETFRGIRDSNIKFVSTNSTEENPITTTVRGMQIGTLFGEAHNATFSSRNLSVDLSAENVNFVDSKIGTLIGYAQNCAFGNIEVSVSMNVTTANSYIGGIVGYAQNCSFVDNTTDIDISNIDDDDKMIGINVRNYQSTDTSITSMGNYIGGIFGAIYGGQYQRIIDNNDYRHAVQSNVDISVFGNASTVCVGGIVGQINGASLSGAENYGDIILEETSGNAYDIRVGAIVGSIIGSGSITYSFSFGDIKHIIESEVQDEYSNVSLTMAGIVAYAENSSSSNNITLQDNISAGNFYPAYKYSTNVDDPNIKSVLNKYASVTYGGIIGVISANINASNNISIATLFNRFDNQIATSYTVNALVGIAHSQNPGNGYEYSVDISDTNYYANVATLCTDVNYGTNVFFGDILNGSTENLVLEGGLNVKIGLEEGEYSDLIFNGEMGGTKLNPSSSIPLEADISRTNYVYLGTGISHDRYYALTNTVVIADGLSVVFSSTEDTGSSEKLAPFLSIDENSSLSGVVVIAQYETNDNKALAGLVMENNGIVYSCNVKHNYDNSESTDNTQSTPQKLVGTLSSGGPVAGLVGTNYGLIKDSFVNADIISNYATDTTNQNQEPIYTGVPDDNNSSSHRDVISVAAAGLVGTNGGVIINSYASGSIYAPNALVDGATSYVYLFAAGMVYDSYTNMKVVCDSETSARISGAEGDQTLNSNIFAFDKNAQNSYYDKIAAEYLISEDTRDDSDNDNTNSSYIAGKDTNELSYNFAGEKSVSDDKFIMIGTFNYDATQAYGYGSFSNDIYKNIDYMKQYTGNGTDSSPYQVPNLGKLKQLEAREEGTSKIYINIINDLNAVYVSREDAKIIQWNSLDIDNVDIDGYDSKDQVTHTISYLSTKNGGIFNRISNSNIRNLKIDNLIFNTIQFGENDSIYMGQLANSVTTSKISDIEFVSINQDLFSNLPFGMSYDKYYYYGNVVGQIGQDSTLSNCILSTPSGTNSSNIKLVLPFSVQAFTYGGIVGLVTDNAIIEHCHVNKDFTVEFDGSPDYASTIIAGGIVGRLQSGKVNDCYINASLNAFSDNIYKSSEEIILYVGGIVGAAGTFVKTNSKIEIVNNNLGTISDSGLTQNSEIYGGNSVNITTSYVGGISAFGGIIENCYNSAANIVGNAKYQFALEPSNATSKDFVREDSATYSSYNIYTNYGNTGYEQYKKLVYMRISQDSNVAGIANSYDSLNYVVNNCTNISGGLDARRMYAYYDVDSSVFGWAPWVTVGYSYMVSVGLAMAIIGQTHLPWGFILIGIGGAMVAGGIYGIAVELSRSIGVDVYHFNDDITASYGFSIEDIPQIYDTSRSSWQSISSLVLEIVNGTVGGGISMIIYLSSAPTLDFLTYKPAYKPRQTNGVDKFTENDYMSLGLGIYEENSVNYIYNLEDNAAGQRNLYVFNVNAHSIGTPKSAGASTSNVAWIEGVYKQKTVNNKVLYVFSDGNLNNKNYDYLWDTSTTTINQLNTVDDVKNMWSEEDWPGFNDDWIISDDGDLVFSNSDEVSSTSNIDMFNNNITVGTNSQGSYAEIMVYDIEDYRGAVNIVNGILNDDDDDNTDDFVIDGIEIGDSKLINLKSSIKNGDVTIKFAFQKEISFNSMAVQGFGVDEQHPFSGTIISETSGDNANISDFLLSDSNRNSSMGLVAYGKDVTIQGVTITYSNQRVTALNNIKNVGGLIGTVVNDGNVTINDTTVTLSVSDYNKNGTISTQKINLGGLIGCIQQNGNINIEATTVTMTTDLAGGNDLSQGGTGIGGLIGCVSGSNIYINNQVKVNLTRDIDEGILSSSANTTIGGAIGRMQDSSISSSNVSEVSNAYLELTGKISAENTVGDTVYVGGLIGYFGGNGSIELTGINIYLSSISATSGVIGTKSYTGGVIGYMENATTLPITDTTSVSVGDINSTCAITSGIGGSEFSEYAYADNFIGNREAGYAWAGQITTNTSVIAMAKPSYDPPTDNDTIKPAIEPIDSKQVIGTIEETTAQSGGSSSTSIRYFKIDSYEYETQVDTNIENSYMNGENSTIYNYQKNVYIITTFGSVGTASGGKYDGQEIHSIKETIYRLTINGYRYDSNEISDVITSQTIDFVSAYSFITTSDLFIKAIKNGTAIPMISRGDNFVPNGITILSNNLNGDGSYSITDGTITISDVPDYPIENNGDEILIDLSLTLESSITNIDSSDINIGDDTDIEDGIINGDEPEADVYDFVTYHSIVMNLSENTDHDAGEVYLNYSDSNYSKYVVIYNPMEGIIYDYAQDSMVNPITANITDSEGNKISLSDISNNLSSEFYIQLPNGKYQIDQGTMASDSSSLSILTTVSGLMRLDNSTDRQYRAIFITINNGFETVQNARGTHYTEYIFLADENRALYYLGNINYTSSNEIEFTNNMPRNAMFFPLQANIIAYQNNLYPLNKIQLVSDINDIQIDNITTTNSQISYFIDATTVEGLKSIQSQTISDTITYSVNFKNINVRSLDNIIVNFTIDKINDEHHEETAVSNNYAYITGTSGTYIYEMLNTPVYDSSDLGNALNSVVLTKRSNNNEQLETEIIVFNYSGSVMTGFVSYTSGFELRTDGNTSYYVLLDDSGGTEVDPDGKNEIEVNVDSSNPLDFGVTYASVGKNTLIKFINGDVTRYIQLPGIGYTFNYNQAQNVLTANLDEKTYTFIYENGQFVLSRFAFNVIMSDEEYTITENYASSGVQIEITCDSEKTLLTVPSNVSWTYFIANNSENNPTIIQDNFDYNFEYWLATNSENYTLNTSGFIDICENGNEQAFATYERNTLERITRYTAIHANDNTINAEIFVYDNNDIIIFVMINGVWELFKSGQDVYLDLNNGSTDFVHIAISENDNIKVLELYSRYDEVDRVGISYDISNGFRYLNTSTSTAISTYSTETLNYAIYTYNSVHINGILQSYTKVEWLYNGQNVSLGFDVAIETSNAVLVPFNYDYAIGFLSGSSRIYYTRSGYKISGIVGGELTLSNLRSLGVRVPRGLSLLYNIASIETPQGTSSISEYVYIRHNISSNWYASLATNNEVTFTYNRDYEGHSTTIVDTLSRGNTTLNGNNVTFSEVINTSISDSESTVTYLWSFDASSNLIKYFPSDTIDNAPQDNYNRYSDLGYEAWNISDNTFVNYFSNIIIPITRNGNMIGWFDTIFGEMSFTIQE